MAHTSIPAQTALANVILHSFKTDAERNNAVRELAKQVDNGTVALVAALTANSPGAEAEHDLLAFLARGIERGEPSNAASIALQHAHVREALLDRVERELAASLTMLLRQPRNSGLVVRISEQTTTTSLASPPLLGDYTSHTTENYVHLAVVYLNFLKQLLRISTTEGTVTISWSTFEALVDLIAASPKDIASTARDVCFSFLAAYKTKAAIVSGKGRDSAALGHRLWYCIDSLLDQSPHTFYRTTAYAIWLRWLDNPGFSQTFESLMQSDKYWIHVLNALASGDVEQRKTCLHILRTSVAISQKSISTIHMVYDSTERGNGPDSVQAHYERFCTVYETIVVGRYFNQAEECIRDLDALASSQTRVQESWLFALLEPAMSNVVQDSIRKMLGNWLMSTDLKVSTHVEAFAKFFRNSFLPWACLGQLFTGTLRGRTRAIRCEHGTRLANFIERLIRNHSADDQTDIRLRIVQSILNFLQSNKTKVIPYAVVYLLHGLAQGLKGNMQPCMGSAELEIILDLPTGTAYPEISRDVLQSCCLELALLSAQKMQNNTVADLTDLRLETMTRKVHQIKLGPASGTVGIAPKWQTLQAYLDELHASRHTCLSGEGLATACQSLIVLLDSFTVRNINTDHLFESLESIWTGLEIQDYPKNVLLILPGLVLHPKVVECTMLHEGLAEIVESYILQLHHFTAGRIYVWSPFMTALRNVLYIAPAAARKFDVADLILEVANKPPTARVEFQLEAAIVQLLPGGENARNYTDYYGEHEEVGYAAFFDLINRLPSVDEDTARETYDKLIDPWANQKIPVPVVNKWKTTVQLQIMLVLQENLLHSVTVPQALLRMDVLHNILAVEPLPRYRLLIEWQIARIIIKNIETSDDVLRRLSTMDHHSNPKYLSSLTKIGLMIACLAECPENYAARLACRLVALSASSKIIVRHEAQWSFPILWDAAESQGWASVLNNPACHALNEYIRSLQQFAKPPAERLLEHLDPVAGHTLANLLQGQYLRLEPPTAETVSVLDIQRLLEKDRQHGLLQLPEGCLPLGAMPGSELTQTEVTQPLQETQEESKASARAAATTALQTKGTAYLSANTTTSEENARATDVIVVASLVDNAYNLGGLSRISEIFGASALYMSRPRVVLGNKDFISVAVASQNHLPIHDLSIENLQAFLTEKKTEGYTVVGVEQTDRSVILGDEFTKLPAKTLLIMGAEKEGIPALVIGECDVLVEVPQRGVTRSMNVQTAAGVVLYEHSRQHKSK